MPEPKNLQDFFKSLEKDEELKIEAICPAGHPLQDAVTKLLQQGLRSAGADNDSVVLNSYDKQSYGSDIKLSLAEVVDCEVTMKAILLNEGKVGNPVIIVDSPAYLEEIYDGNTGNVIKIVGKKVFFALNSDGDLERTTALGSSTAYEPYPAVVSSSWGRSTVPAASANGFVIHRKAFPEEEYLLYEYLANPTDMQNLALAVRCSEEDQEMRDQKRKQVIDCVASDKKHQKRMDDLNKPSGARPFPPERSEDKF